MARWIISMVFCVIFVSCFKYYRNYDIIGVELHHIVLDDSLKTGKNYYLLAFKYTLCNPGLRIFSGGGVEPALNGTISNIPSITIIDSCQKDATRQLRGWSVQGSSLLSKENGETFEMFPSPSIKSLENSINTHEKQTKGLLDRSCWLFYMPKSSTPLQSIMFKGKRSKVMEETNTLCHISNSNH